MEATFNLQELYFKKDQKMFIFTDQDDKEYELSIYVLNRIVSFIANKYLYNRIKYAEMVEISSRDLNNIDTGYRRYINWLKRNEVIIVNEHYETPDFTKNKDGKCKMYSFHDDFKNFGRVTAMKKDKSEEVTNPDQSYLIEIDKTVLKNIKRDFKAINIHNIPIEKSYKIHTKKLEVINFKSYLSSELNFWRFKNNDIFFNWKSGRLYTTITQCSKSTRLYNFYFDDKLKNLDIPSSFPLWLAIWLKAHGADVDDYEFRDYCTLVKAPMDKHGNFIKNEEGELKTQFYNDLLAKMDQNRNITLSKQNKGSQLYCQIVEVKDDEWDRDGFVTKTKKVKCNLKLEEEGWCPEHGYIVQNNQLDGMRCEKPYISKAQAKEEFQKWLNGDNELPTLINYIFQMYYGDIQSIVDKHKNGNKRFMYDQLVAMETNFIFNTICARLYKEIPEIKIFTCHDQIYFEHRFCDQVENIWNEELKKVYDQLPSNEEWEMDYEGLGIHEL